ncbi:septum formation family protein [Catellatospora sichuanensis]|uniref:septum formation family protein n=1 Tax=Catellatospora sichuanensis TaxID=1969805 RepID=UPI0016431AA4|nr:septum formation family protein [Catellatospora sichuanensis]
MGRMVRRLVAMVMGLAVAGCTQSGSPVEFPGPSPSLARLTTPAAGTCLEHDWFYPSYQGNTGVISCDDDHYIEIAAVHAGRAIPDDPAAIAAAFAQCRQEADGYLGEAWWRQRLAVRVSTPGEEERAAGARWYRCDLLEQAQLPTYRQEALVVGRDAPLSTPAGPDHRRLQCVQVGGDVRSLIVSTAHEIECAQPHNAELAAFVVAPAVMQFPSYTDLAGREIRRQLGEQCRAAAGDFVSDRRLAYHFWVVPTSGATGWSEGDRGVRCFVWLDGRNVTGSLHR